MGEDDTHRIIVRSLAAAGTFPQPHAPCLHRASRHPLERHVHAAYEQLRREPIPTRLLALLDATLARRLFH